MSTYSIIRIIGAVTSLVGMMLSAPSFLAFLFVCVYWLFLFLHDPREEESR
jgi:protein-S-isoprenylcysteine O-methyltransferase Ste14